MTLSTNKQERFVFYHLYLPPVEPLKQIHIQHLQKILSLVDQNSKWSVAAPAPPVIAVEAIGENIEENKPNILYKNANRQTFLLFSLYKDRIQGFTKASLSSVLIQEKLARE